MMSTKYSTQFLLFKEKEQPDAKLRFRVRWNKDAIRLSFNIPYRVDIAKWNKDAQRCFANTSHGKKKISARVINSVINDYEAAFEKTKKHFDLKNKTPESEEFKEIFNKNIGKEKSLTKQNQDLSLFEVFDEFVVEQGKKNVWSSETHVKMTALKNKLLNFDSNLSFDQLNEKKLIDYQYYLQEEHEHKNSTLLKQIAFLKWFFKMG